MKGGDFIITRFRNGMVRLSRRGDCGGLPCDNVEHAEEMAREMADGVAYRVEVEKQ